MSKIEVNEIDAQCGSTITVGSSGKTVTVPGNIVKSNTLQASDGGNIVNQCGTNLTVGASGDTITFPSGTTVVNNGSQTGFGRTGTVDWDTTAKTSAFTAVSGNGYFVNTTSGAITVTLPASPSAGDIVAVADYAGTAATNNITIARNGSNIEGGTDDATIYENRDAITLVYVDGTQGWVPVNNNEKSGILPPAYVAATGGTITCCGDYKIHTFTGPGTFTVTCAGNVRGSNSVDYLIVAGGAGGGGSNNPGGGGGGGGAGGFRESKATGAPWTASPLATCVSEPVSAQGYPITVGGGGPGAPTGLGSAGSGSNSVFSIYTSAGGGFGGSPGAIQSNGQPGGSGGGGTYQSTPGGTGNTPPTSPPQGNDGGDGKGGPQYTGGSGGGAGGAGIPASDSAPAGRGGDGGSEVVSAISSSPTSYAGGGGGGGGEPPAAGGGNGGGGGAGSGGDNPNGSGANASPANRGSGGGGGAGFNCSGGGNGSSGVVIIRYKFQ